MNIITRTLTMRDGVTFTARYDADDVGGLPKSAMALAKALKKAGRKPPLFTFIDGGAWPADVVTAYRIITPTKKEARPVEWWSRKVCFATRAAWLVFIIRMTGEYRHSGYDEYGEYALYKWRDEEHRLPIFRS